MDIEAKRKTENMIPISSTKFPDHTPTRRHSALPSLRQEIAAAIKKFPDLNHVSEHEPEQPKSEQPKPEQPKPEQPKPELLKEPSWDQKVSGDQIIQDPNGLRVLLVEDNEINLKLLVACMRRLKLSHITANNGLEALNAYKYAHDETKHFDVIFMGSSSHFYLTPQ